MMTISHGYTEIKERRLAAKGGDVVGEPNGAWRKYPG